MRCEREPYHNMDQSFLVFRCYNVWFGRMKWIKNTSIRIVLNGSEMCRREVEFGHRR